MPDTPRLIEFAFPLKQTSLDSVHEKNVRHGHISTLHIWPARRPLAACRAALIATLLPDPSAEPKPEGMKDEDWHKEVLKRRQALCEKIGGTIRQVPERKRMPNGQIVERIKEETVGGILHWGQETENKATLDWFRGEIRKAYGGRAPKVLDPFAGGGAIPLEAMRLGCEAAAVDINPVAWFILKCTLEYPQKLAGQKRPLPPFVLKNRAFMEAFFAAQGLSKAEICRRIEKLGHATAPANTDRQHDLPTFEAPDPSTQADLSWHVRAWGQWVLEEARKELGRFYPIYADFEPLDQRLPKPYEPQPPRLLALGADGAPDPAKLNEDFTAEYLRESRNPRWIAKPAVAYLWARTVTCKNCRSTVPLLKTRWLCKKDRQRVLLTMEATAEKAGAVFGVQKDVSAQGGNAAQKREHDKRLGAGTMSRAGAACPCCGTIMTMEDIRVEGRAGRLGAVMTAVIVDGPHGKEYRRPTPHELACAESARDELDRVFADVPFGLPTEPTPIGASRQGGGSPFTVYQYGQTKWQDIFSGRQLHALGSLCSVIRRTALALPNAGYPEDWSAALQAYLADGMDRIADRQSTVCRWDNGYTKLQGSFTRFALPITWDYCEGNPLSDTTGNFLSCLEWVAEYIAHGMVASLGMPQPHAANQSAILTPGGQFDCVITDPPYYDAIPYSDLMDFFYIWLRRTLHGVSPTWDDAFAAPLSPKWDHDKQDGELIDDASRHGNDKAKSKAAYEDGMARVFQACSRALTSEGRLVVVFAHKQPDAWETLASAIIRAGFVVDGSWPIQTEMSNRTRGLSSAALASSVWLVCKKRAPLARPGWDNQVLAEMRANIADRLREYWDAGIRGPDFVWAATGPAMEAYSKHPVVKKANQPNEIMRVTEFLNHVRRMVVDFVVGRVLTGGEAGSGTDVASMLDAPTAYYLLHRYDFGFLEAPAGTCILYATACGLSDRDLVDTWDMLARTGGDEPAEAEEGGQAEEDADGEDADAGATESGNKVRLKSWSQRRSRSMGYEAPTGRTVPLIDRVHRLMQLWKAGDVHKVDEFLDEHGMRRHELFKRLLQSILELAEQGGEERALLESISNHVGAKGARDERNQALKLGET